MVTRERFLQLAGKISIGYRTVGTTASSKARFNLKALHFTLPVREKPFPGRTARVPW
jgi:hypothetical protein